MRERRSDPGGGAAGRAPAYEGAAFGSRGRGDGECADSADVTPENLREPHCVLRAAEDLLALMEAAVRLRAPLRMNTALTASGRSSAMLLSLLTAWQQMAGARSCLESSASFAPPPLLCRAGLRTISPLALGWRSSVPTVLTT